MELTTGEAAGGDAVTAAAAAAAAAIEVFPLGLSKREVTTAGAVLAGARSFAEAVLSAGTASDPPRETTTAAPRPGAADAVGDRTAPGTVIALAHNAER